MAKTGRSLVILVYNDQLLIMMLSFLRIFYLWASHFEKVIPAPCNGKLKEFWKFPICSRLQVAILIFLLNRKWGRLLFFISFDTEFFLHKSFRYKSNHSRCKSFHILGLKNQDLEDIHPKCFSCSLAYNTWSEQNFRAISLLEFVSKRPVSNGRGTCNVQALRSEDARHEGGSHLSLEVVHLLGTHVTLYRIHWNKGRGAY